MVSEVNGLNLCSHSQCQRDAAVGLLDVDLRECERCGRMACFSHHTCRCTLREWYAPVGSLRGREANRGMV